MMPKTTRFRTLLLLSALALGGCSQEAVYTQESFAADSPFKLKIDGENGVACESARRSLLGQGYLIEHAGSEEVKGRKAYRSTGNLSTFIEMNVVCAPDSVGSTLYANGVLSTYDLKKSGSTASVGLSAVGSISLPIGQSADALVKIAEETITDKAFYGRFFAAVDHTLREIRVGKPAAEPGVRQPDPAIAIETGPAVGPTVMPVAPESPGAQPQPPAAAAGATPIAPAPEPVPVAAPATDATPAPDAAPAIVPDAVAVPAAPPPPPAPGDATLPAPASGPGATPVPPSAAPATDTPSGVVARDAEPVAQPAPAQPAPPPTTVTAADPGDAVSDDAAPASDASSAPAAPDAATP